jgi:hypothetical protein
MSTQVTDTVLGLREEEDYKHRFGGAWRPLCCRSQECSTPNTNICPTHPPASFAVSGTTLYPSLLFEPFQDWLSYHLSTKPCWLHLYLLIFAFSELWWLETRCSSWALLAYTCNPSYSGGRDQEDCDSKPALANSSQDPISKKKTIIKKGWWGGSRCRPWVQAPAQQKNKTKQMFW